MQPSYFHYFRLTTFHSAEALLVLFPIEQGQSSSAGLVGYLLHRRALPPLLDAHAGFPLSEQLEVALSTRADWGLGTRFKVTQAMLAVPHSETGATHSSSSSTVPSAAALPAAPRTRCASAQHGAQDGGSTCVSHSFCTTEAGAAPPPAPMPISGPPTSHAAPPGRALRTPCPVHRQTKHARVGRAYQAVVGACGSTAPPRPRRGPLPP